MERQQREGAWWQALMNGRWSSSKSSSISKRKPDPKNPTHSFYGASSGFLLLNR